MTTLDSQVVKVFSKWPNFKVGQVCLRESEKYTILSFTINQIYNKKTVALLQLSQVSLRNYESDLLKKKTNI